MELYFDGAATTPLLPEVEQALTNSFSLYGNPSSLHAKGVASDRAIQTARRAVLAHLGAKSGRVIFTGSGTEANNLAIAGVLRRFRERGRHILTSAIEHPSVLEAARGWQREGWEVTFISPRKDGGLRTEDVLAAVRPDTVLVSLMHVNNETGAILPVIEIGQMLRERPKTLFHVDGIQAFGKLETATAVRFADLYSISGHKVGAPKGVGALYLRDGLELEPLCYGGGQEFGLRSGTENVLGIIALGRAAAVAAEQHTHNLALCSALATSLIEGLEAIPGCIVQRPESASPYIVSASFPGLRGEVLVHAFEAQGLYVSTGSACSTRRGHASRSHVLTAMGRSEAEVTGTIRFSLGWWLTPEMVEQALSVVSEQVRWLTGVTRRKR
ncbi:cysteine desulfurase family protein [Alicyclobacillus sp. ALC3]|uniref:cysteine desulfurase family protein n=1 Tax=Alicyclobacillus sp. ALC3 TaxID=2796143 RepID=UPI002377F3B4|nr:cysteine desulfurase family protein [Alicyclobacillus sp. ALC3]WDL97462.1 cysteine desulfurase [Alicyclobacillus sp. ALC3]